MLDSNCLYVEDENGLEKKMTILFTFDHEDKQYVVFQDADHDADQVYASRYDDEGNLFPIETEEEWEMVEEVINTFAEDEENA